MFLTRDPNKNSFYYEIQAHTCLGYLIEAVIFYLRITISSSYN